MKKISDLSELEQSWLWQGHIMMQIFRERGIDKIEFINYLCVGDARARQTIFNTYQRYFTNQSSGRAEVPVLLNLLGINEEPQEFGIVREHVEGRGVRHTSGYISYPTDKDKTCQHCGAGYERADIDHEHYFSKLLICPHCKEVVGAWEQDSVAKAHSSGVRRLV